jgi:DNA-binding NarL/FixJ family response regulator
MAETLHPGREPLSLRGLKSRAARVFDESRDAMRTCVVLRLQSDFLRRRLDQGLRTAVTPRHMPPSQAAFSKLSPREISVLRLIVDGKTTREIATELGIAFKTAAAHRSHIMSKLEVTNSAAVVREAFRLGLLE